MTIRMPLLLAVASLGCGGNDATGPSSADWKGNWAYSHLASGEGTTCSETGSIHFASVGSHVAGTFDGRGGCESASISLDYAKTGPASGQVDGDGVAFTLTASLESCLYQGKLEAGAPDKASGSLVCTPADGGVPRHGSWSMRR
jgi:hypothetical protein